AVFGQERDGRAIRDHVREVISDARGNENYLRWLGSRQVSELTGDIESGFRAQADIDQHDVRFELAAGAARLRSGRHRTDHVNAAPLEQFAGSAEEFGAVIDDDAPHRHAPIVPGAFGFVIAASWHADAPASCQETWALAAQTRPPERASMVSAKRTVAR